jgi:tRNA A-37 threonylcarbamoyl transferase component Bud32/tetratricopeptide (TPR) repeat protein
MSDTDLRDQLQSALGASYTLERELGGGGMSRVFLAEETALGRKVVVKVLAPELLAGMDVDRFRREIQLAARLQQAQIVPLLSAGEIDGVPYYTMPFVEGESLRARLARDGRLSVADVVSILRDVTRALAYAHEHGVVHRDIKPDNVLLSGGTAVVTDFGIAKALNAAKDARSTDSGLTQVGTSVGTPIYISPEQAAGDPNVDARSDIYSLGCMAFELLTGRPPFPDRTPQRTLVAHLTEPPPPIASLRADIPPALAALVMRMLEKDPAARPQSASEIAVTLDAVATGAFASERGGLLGRPMSAATGIALYAGGFVAVALLAKAAVVAFGVPDWVFLGAVGLMIIGAPVVALAALGTSRHITWPRAARGGAVAVGAFAAVVVAIMVLRAFGIGPVGSLLAAGKLDGSARLLVVDFTAGADTSLSHVVTEAVRTDLGQSKVVSIMPPAAIAGALARMQRPPSTPVNLKLAQEIAQREGAKAIVAGDVSQLGSGYVVSIRLVSADSGAELAAYHASVDGTGQLLDAIDGLTRKLRGRIGESLKSVRNAPALDQVTTSSLPALRKYADANRAFDLSGDYTRAAQVLREAVALDTSFAMAYRKLGVALSNAGMPRAQVDSALTRAYELRDHLPEREKYLTIASYYQAGPGMDRQKAIEALQQALAVDSTNVTASINLAGLLMSRRELGRADSVYTAINNSSGASQGSMSAQLAVRLTQGRLAAAESIYRVMAERFPTAENVKAYPAVFAYMHGHVDSTEAFWRSKMSDPNPLMKLSAASSLASIALLHGRIRETRALASQARKLNAARGVPDNPLADSMTSAVIEIWYLEQFDKGVRALDAAQAAVPLHTLPVERRPYFSFATYYAWAGHPEKARAVLAQYDADIHDPAMRRNLEPSRHAALAEILIAEHKPLDGIREMWKQDTLSDGPASSCADCLDSDLGRAYDLANMPDSAIVHWERYLSEATHRSVSSDAPILAGIHKRLGEIYQGRGDLEKAESHLTAFVELWKNADPELQPKVADAKRRLAEIAAKRKG